MITDNTNSSVAKLLANENITVVQDNVPTAMFDVKNRVLTLPLWADVDAAIQSLLTGHEVGHALYTPEEGWHEAVCSRGGNYKSFLNVVEDARIEKLIQRKYPGLRRDFVSGYKQLMSKGFFGSTDAAEFGLIDRINTHFKCGMAANIPFAEDEVQWVDRIAKLETWEQVVEVTDELYEFCKQKEEEQKQEEEERNEESESEDGDDDSGDYSDGSGYSMHEDFDEDEDDADSDDAEDGESGSTHESSEGEEEEDSSSSDGDGDGDSEEESDTDSSSPEEDGEGDDNDDEEEWGNTGGTEGGVSEEDGPRSLTDEALRESIEREYAGDASRIDVVNIELRADNHEQYFIGYKDVIAMCKQDMDGQSDYERTLESGAEVYDEWYSSARRSISLMVKEFEMKKSATQLSRTRISRSGTLDTLKMNNYRCSEDIFKKVKSIPKGKNHGFIMVVDLSGSMNEILSDVVKQTMLMTHFCRRINVPFRVYGFTDYLSRREALEEQDRGRAELEEQDRGLMTANPDRRLRMIEIFNEKMSKSDMLFISHALMGSCTHNRRLHTGGWKPTFTPFYLGGTPLDSSILALIPKIEEFKKQHRLDIMNTIFLTDGMSHEINYVAAKVEGEHLRDLPRKMAGNHITLRYGKKTYSAPKNGGNYTGTLLSILKDVTGSSVLGYFVFSGRGRSSAMGAMRSMRVSYDAAEEKYKLLKKGFHAVLDVEGYDEMYLVWSKNMVVSNASMDVEAGSAKGALKKAFGKTSTGQKQARALLQDIVKRVA